MLRWGIIGTGDISDKVVSDLLGIEGEITAVWGRTPERAEDFASRLELPRSLFAEAEAEEWRPLVRQLADELGSMPEGELVRVTTGEEVVLISQRGGRFRIDVDAPDAEVHISLPRRSAARILDKIADL